MTTHFINAVFPQNNSMMTGSITVEGGVIQKITPSDLPIKNSQDTIFDCQNNFLLPGFIDMHTHGWAGFDSMDGNSNSVLQFSEQLSHFGVTSFLATTFTHSRENITKAVTAIKEAQLQQEEMIRGAQILGVHLEGPYINVEAKGAQSEKYIRSANPEEYEEWLDSGIIKEVTVAPEIRENHEFMKECVKKGIVVSVGHCNASYDDVVEAVDLGATQTTHTFNGMKGIHHRNPGAAGAALTQEKISCEVIADLLHIHPAIIKLIVLAKGTEKVILITDAVSAAGLPDGEYRVLGDKVRINKDGKIVNQAGSLSGSSLSMDQALKNVMIATGKSLSEVWPMTSRNAARQLKLKKGEIQVGYDADFVLLDANYAVEETIVKGQSVYKNI